MENHKFFTQKPCDKPAKHCTNHTRHETQKKSKTVKKNKNNSAPFSDLWRNLAPAPLNFGATLRVPGLLFSLAVGNIHRMSALSNNKQIMGS
jgi:hypothetical protein